MRISCRKWPALLPLLGLCAACLHPQRVFVDGADVVDFRSLTQIPASTILSIEILSGIEGTTYYGSNAVSGVILIRTKNGS